MNGVININKPLGITSFDVVYKIRKLSGTKKVGHTGTLDPYASGVLPICLGKGTKIVDYITNGNKEYKALLKLGVVTDTYDKEGTILSETFVNCTEEEIIKVINSFVGEISQIPPMYSALKVNGKRLYELARQGLEIDRKPRNITIYNIEIETINIPYVSFTVKCSKGTYIRSLCYDIGEKLNCGGTMWDLQRTASGTFSIDNSINLEELTQDNISSYIIPIEKALGEFPELFLENSYRKHLLNGLPIYDNKLVNSLDSNEVYKVFLNNTEFIGLGNIQNEGFKIKKFLFQE